MAIMNSPQGKLKKSKKQLKDEVGMAVPKSTLCTDNLSHHYTSLSLLLIAVGLLQE